MAKTVDLIQEEMEEGNFVLDNGRKLLHIGLGAVTMARDETVKFADRLVERGESTEKDTRQRFEKFMDAREKDLRNRAKQAEKEMEKQLDYVLHRLNIPTKSDITKLNRKITQLSKKVDDLAKSA